MSRSSYWDDVAALAERSRRASAEFDPSSGTPADCIEAGVAPIVRLYIETCREGADLSAVERSLLEGALNDWLQQYAACRELPAYEGTAFSVHEVAMEAARTGEVETAVTSLLKSEGSMTDHEVPK